MLAVGDLMRPEGVIFLAAVFCCALCAIIEQPKKKRALSLLVTLTSFTAAYFAAKWAEELILGALGLAPYGLGNSVPEWKLVLGLDHKHGGGYSDEYIYILNLADTAARRAAGRDIILQHLAQRSGWVKFLITKVSSFWTTVENLELTMSGIPLWKEIAGSALEYLLYDLAGIELAVRITAYGFAAAGCARLAGSAIYGAGRSTSAVPLIAAAILCGTVLVYLAIEVQSRYRFFAMPFVFMLASVPFSIVRKKQK